MRVPMSMEELRPPSIEEDNQNELKEATSWLVTLTDSFLSTWGKKGPMAEFENVCLGNMGMPPERILKNRRLESALEH
jgi:hypothetical protein